MSQNVKKKLSIIGANSYIARNLLKVIDRNQFEINLYDYQTESIDNELNYSCVNIIDRQSVDQIEVDCEAIFIFAGLTGTSQGFSLYNQFIDVNEKGLLNILNRVVNENSKAKIVFPSTRLVYKGEKDVPLKEDAKKEFKTLYAINKYACEKYLEMYRNLYNVNYCVARICVPYGNLVTDTNAYGTIGFFLSQARSGKDITIYGDGSQKRSFIHIYDLCQMLFELSFKEMCVDTVFNVGGPDTLSILEVAESIGQLYGVQVKKVEWPEESWKLESGDTIFDSYKVESLLKYKYEYTFKEWIKYQKDKR